MLEYLPDPYPDELLYSVWARYSDDVRYAYKREVLQELFGTMWIEATVDLPSHLAYFVDHLPIGHRYTVDYFIDHHTLLPFYAAFHSPEHVRQLREQMISSNGQALHRRAGVVQSTIPSPQWLRYCPGCVHMDRENFGECYWHRLHQVPGVEICPVHRTLLENSTVRARHHFSTREFTSAEHAIVDTTPRDAESSPFFQTFMDIALDVCYLLEHSCCTDPPSLRKRYGVLLSQRGFLASAGSMIRIHDCLKAFMDYYSQTLLATLHCRLKHSPLDNRIWLNRVLHPSNKAQHPLRHILAIRFLGSSAETFFHLDIEPTMPFGEGPWPCLNPVCEHYQQRHITTCQIHRQRGRLVGRFACSCGFTYSRKGPDTSLEDAFRRENILAYGAKWEALLRDLWFDPAVSSGSIYRRLGFAPDAVKRQAVKLHLPFPRISSRSTISGMPQTPKKDISWYRTQWLALLQDTPQAEGRTALKRKRPRVFEWLNKYDKEWLRAHLPPKKSRVRQRTPLFAPSINEEPLHEDVTSQDAQIAEAVRAKAALIITLDPPKRVTMHRIRADIPQVWQLKNMPEKAPLTVQALRDVIETWEAFAVRRIWRKVQKYQEKQVCPSRNGLIWSTNVHPYLHVPIVKQALDEAMLELSQFA
jgi:hypothetical protein